MLMNDVLNGSYWAMEPGALRSFLDVAARIVPDQYARRTLADASPGQPPEILGGVAVLHVRGVILKDVPDFARLIGLSATSTTELGAALSTAVADPRVERIHLEIDSPGGTVAGVKDLGDAIRAARATKQVTANAADLAASAAYWLGAQADTFTCGDSAAIGSIGVYSAVADYSKAAEAEGIKVHVVSSHDLKGAGVPGSVITDAQLADMQRVIDSYAALFEQAVVDGRGMSAEAVHGVATGQVWIGEEARKLGLCDRAHKQQPAPLGAINQESAMDPKQEAELRAQVAKLETEKAEAQAAAQQALATARAQVVARYPDRVTPANKAAVDQFAAFCGADMGKLEQYLASLPVAVHTAPVGNGGNGHRGEKIVETNDPASAKVEQILGLEPGSIALLGDVENFNPQTRAFTRANGTHFKIVED